jgi:hypothetical protein
MAEILKNVKFLLLLCVIAIVPISGCTAGTGNTTGGGPGLVIETFKSSLTSIESGERVGLQLEVRNVGEYNGIAGLGVPTIAEIMAIDPTEWMVNPATVVDVGTLLMPDAESQTQGALGKANWDLQAPLLSRGTTKTYEVRARVYYPYETKAIKPIWFVTAEELRRIVQNGEALAGEAQTQSAGPLTVTVNAGNFVKAREFRDSKFQLQIKIDNTGGGQVRGRDYPVAVTIQYPTWVIPVGGSCPPQSQWTTPPIYSTDVPMALPTPIGNTYVKLWNGRSTDITCEFAIVQPPSSRTSGNFDVTLGYIYSVDASTQVTVKGTEEI